MCTSEKIPTIISDMDANIPETIPNIRRILLHISRGIQEYNPAKNGIYNKSEIIQPQLKK
jgi:hypothetical protein